MESFKYVHCSIYNWNQSTKKYEDDQLEKYLREMFLFSLAVCIEYRGGKFQDADPNGIESEMSLIALSLTRFELDRAGEEAKKYEREDFALLFREKYYKNKRYFFFRSLFDFTVGKSAFKPEVAIGEIDKVIEKDSPENPEWQVYNRAPSQNYFDLSNDEFQKFYEELLGHTLQGVYPPSNMIIAFSYLEWMANVLGKNINELKKALEDGITKSFEKFGKDDSLKIRYHPDEKHNKVTKELIQLAVDQNSKLGEEEDHKETEQLNRLVKKDFTEFFEEIEHERFNYKPVLKGIDFPAFDTAFKQAVDNGENRALNQLLTRL